MTFDWLTPFVDSFLNSDWPELVIYFHTNQQDGEQNALEVNFSDDSDLRRGFEASLRNFLNRDISRRKEREFLCSRFPLGGGYCYT